MTAHGCAGDVVRATDGARSPRRRSPPTSSAGSCTSRCPYRVFDPRGRAVRVGAAVGLWDAGEGRVPAARPEPARLLQRRVPRVRAVDPEHLDGRQPERRAGRRRPEPAARGRGLPQARRAHARRERRPADGPDEPHHGQPLRGRAGPRQLGRRRHLRQLRLRSARLHLPVLRAAAALLGLRPREGAAARAATAWWSACTAPTPTTTTSRAASTEPPLSVWQMLAEEGHPSIMVQPNARGKTYCYFGMAGADVFEAWADVASHYRLDPRHALLTGSSMGGFGTYKLATQFPDLFKAIFPNIAPEICALTESRRGARRAHRRDRHRRRVREPAQRPGARAVRPGRPAGQRRHHHPQRAAASTSSATATTPGTSRARTPARATRSTGSSCATSTRALNRSASARRAQPAARHLRAQRLRRATIATACAPTTPTG